MQSKSMGFPWWVKCSNDLKPYGFIDDNIYKHVLGFFDVSICSSQALRPVFLQIFFSFAQLNLTLNKLSRLDIWEFLQERPCHV